MRYLLTALLLVISVNCYAETLRVIYLPDGGIKVMIPAKPNHTTEDFNKAMANDSQIAGLPYEDMDRASLPVDSNGKFIDRHYWIGKKGEGVKIDTARKEKEAQENTPEKKLERLGLTKEELKELLK